jgi:large subunit ribosomal protein L29
MSKTSDIREMSDEQIRLVWKDAAEALFRLRLQAQTEKLAAPSDVRKQRRTIARCQTILVQRGQRVDSPVATVAEATVAGDGSGSPQHEKHAKKRPASGRAKLRSPGKAGGAAKRQIRKRATGGK